KPHIEQRSMDCGPIDVVMAAQAFWKGLMYDGGILDRALRMAPRLSRDDYFRLQLEVARHGLDARADSLSVQMLAESAIEMSRAGLRATSGEEARYLDLIEESVIRERVCPADVLIRNFEGSWRGDIHKAIEYMQIADCELK
ncbi:MAG TPA: hypothetical protein VLD57_05790, partial [Blastocatellia bacterium]|nr:hypothetical protein [Blastocatellia bacterium]